jgi:hypothetical protein
MNSLPTLKVKKIFDRISSMKFLVFPEHISKAALSGYLEKEWLINTKKIEVVKVPNPT